MKEMDTGQTDEDRVVVDRIAQQVVFLQGDLRYHRGEISRFVEELDGKLDKDFDVFNRKIGALSIACHDFINFVTK